MKNKQRIFECLTEVAEKQQITGHLLDKKTEPKRYRQETTVFK